jgi:hypothetical protein
MELWLEIIRQLNWTTAMAMCMACKYSYRSLRKYFQCPKIEIKGVDLNHQITVSVIVKHGRIYYFRRHSRRDRVFKSIGDMARFATEIEKLTADLQLEPGPLLNRAKYCNILEKEGGYKTWKWGEPVADAVDKFIANFLQPLDYPISKNPGNLISVTFGEKGPRKKLRMHRGRRRRKISGSFEVEFLLEADGNFEWKAPPCYDYRTIYAKKVYEDLKAVITSNKAHLKHVEVPSWEVSENSCIAYFKATYADKSGIGMFYIVLPYDTKK